MKNFTFLIKSIIAVNFATAIGFSFYSYLDSPINLKFLSQNSEQAYYRQIKLRKVDDLSGQNEEKTKAVEPKTPEKGNVSQQKADSKHYIIIHPQKPLVSPSPSPSRQVPAPVSPAQTEPVSAPLSPTQPSVKPEKANTPPPSPSVSPQPVVTYTTNLTLSSAPKFQDSSVHLSSPSPNPSPSLSTNSQQPVETPLYQANNVAAGLLVAQNDGHIAYNSQEYKRYQTAILLLRKGNSLEEAARKANLPSNDLYQVMKWGENRPGNLDQHRPPILTSAHSEVDDSIRHANDIAAGLLIADRKGHINHGTIQYKRVQTAIHLLRRNRTLEQAAYKSNVSPKTLKQLIIWGQERYLTTQIANQSSY